MTAPVLRRKRSEEQYADIVAAMGRRWTLSQKEEEQQEQSASEFDARGHALFDTLLRADVQSAKQCYKQVFGMKSK